MNRTITGFLLLMLFGPVATSVAQDLTHQPLGMLPPLASLELKGRTLFGQAGQSASPPIPISLREAIDRGLRHDLGALLSAQDIRMAQGVRWEAMKDVLPSVSAHLYQSRETINTAAFGFDLGVIGPFNVFDARVAVTQPVFDLRGRHMVKAESAIVDARRHSHENVREFVVATITNLYLQTVAAANRLRETRGLVGGVELEHVAERKTVPATMPQRVRQDQLLVLENALKRQKLALARAIGIPPGQDFTLTDQIAYSPIRLTSVEDALDRAYLHRPDYQEAQARVKAAEARLKARSSARLPSVAVQGDYGNIGPSASTAVRTFGVRARVSLSIFDAERHGDLMQAGAELEQARARLADLRNSIYYDVQTALLDLQTTDMEVRLSRDALETAEARLVQTRTPKLDPGSSVDLVAGVQRGTTAAAVSQDDEAHEAVLSARHNYTSALYAYNAAKLNLMRAFGSVEKTMGEFFASSAANQDPRP